MVCLSIYRLVPDLPTGVYELVRGSKMASSLGGLLGAYSSDEDDDNLENHDSPVQAEAAGVAPR